MTDSSSEHMPRDVGATSETETDPDEFAQSEDRRDRNIPDFFNPPSEDVTVKKQHKGVVLENAQLRSGEWVKIKRFIKSEDPNWEKAARREIAVALLFSGKSGFVKVVGYSFADGELQLVMKNCLGGTLSEQFVAREIGVNLQELTTLARRIGEALITAHTQNPPIYHVDIKPSNILLETNTLDEPVLADWGSSNQVRDEIFATPVYHYIPSLTLGEITYRNDIYSFMVVLYQILTLHNLPFGIPHAQLKFKEISHVDFLRQFIAGSLTYLPLEGQSTIDDSLRPYLPGLDRVFRKVAEGEYELNEAYQSFSEFYIDLMTALSTAEEVMPFKTQDTTLPSPLFDSGDPPNTLLISD